MEWWIPSIQQMVYIKLAEALYQRIKEHVPAEKVVRCNQQLYLPYPEFKRIALQHALPLHREIGRQDILTYAQMDQLIEQEKQTPHQRRLIEELKSKRELRLLAKINPTGRSEDYYFQAKQDGQPVKEMADTISFSMAFIFTFFMAGVTGYYVGAFFLGWSLAHSLCLALAFIVVTLIVETSLFIIKQNKKAARPARTYRPQPENATDRTQGKQGVERTSKKEKIKVE